MIKNNNVKDIPLDDLFNMISFFYPILRFIWYWSVVRLQLFLKLLIFGQTTFCGFQTYHSFITYLLSELPKMFETEHRQSIHQNLKWKRLTQKRRWKWMPKIRILLDLRGFVLVGQKSQNFAKCDLYYLIN